MAWTGAGKPLLSKDFQVRSISISSARQIVISEHYAKGASNTAVYLHGLFELGCGFDDQAQGVAWWIPPTKAAGVALAGEDWRGVLSLSRLAVRSGLGGNGASILMSRSVRMIDRDRWPYLVTYADTWRGHTGAIYKATGWRDAGETSPEAVYVKDGRMIARKAGPKTRTHAQMIELGAEMVGRFKKRRFVLEPSA